MSKKPLIFFASTLVIFGCTTALKSRTENFQGVESESHASHKGITRFIAQEAGTAAQLQPGAPQPSVPEVAPVDPMLVRKEGKERFYDCRTIRQATYVLGGQSYAKFKLDDDIQLRCPNVRVFNTALPWRVKKEAWTAQDEADFSAFIKQLGDSGCNNLDICLSQEKSNALISPEDMQNLYYADCADLPYYLRGYFAFKKGLPFTFISNVTAVPLSEIQEANRISLREKIVATQGEEGGFKFDKQRGDLRASLNGNVPATRYNIPNSQGDARDFSKIKFKLNDAVSTATYRMLGGDFYSPKISPEEIRPGTAIYGVKGHVALIYDVLPNGEFKVIDAHPGNSISHKGWIADEFLMDKTERGGMFKNFRPVKVENPVVNLEGVVTAGMVTLARDEEIPGFSMEQYDSANFVFKNQKLTMEEWVYVQLSRGAYRVQPLNAMTAATEALCRDFKERVESVEKAVASGLTSQSITAYPVNIYAAAGEWETHSSPSGDLRRRSGTLAIITLAKNLIKRVTAGDVIVSYAGSDLKSDLIAAFQAAAQSCTVSYKNSVGSRVDVNLLQLTKRVGLFSFDPYMCPEARWGATGSEAAGCGDSPEKKEIYKLTQFLRNQNVKDPAAVHGYTLDQLRRLDQEQPGSNNPEKYNYDIVSQLMAL